METKRYFNKNDLKHGVVIRDEKFWYYNGLSHGGMSAYYLSNVSKARVIIWGVWLNLNERKAVHWGDYHGTLEFVASVDEPGVYILREYRGPATPVEKWIIWNPASDKPVTTTYSSETQAVTVAERLAKAHPGETFHIAKIVAGRVAEFTMRTV